MTRKRVLVFDSGVGGLSVVDAIVQASLEIDIDYLADNAWLPYGEKTPHALLERVPALIAAVAAQLAPDAVVLACNTASTIALDAVRAAVPAPVVGVVPPIKPAAERTKSGVIALLATPATIARPYTDDLIAKHAAGVHVIRVGSTELVAAAETKLGGDPVGEGKIASAIAGVFRAPRGDEVDIVALACTHFPLLADELAAAAPRRVAWLQSGPAIAARLATVLSLSTGAARLRRAAFTHLPGARLPGFAERGFSVAASVQDAPSYDIAPAAGLGHG